MRPKPIRPGPGQESVWDYPRPPRLEPCAKHVTVRVAGASGWYYPSPVERFAAIRDHVAFYPEAMDRCTVDGEDVRPQPGASTADG